MDVSKLDFYQQSYSEEEVLDILKQYALEEHLITSSKPDVWFNKFKKEQNERNT